MSPIAQLVLAAVLSALLSGALGYVAAIVKRDTAIALLQAGQTTIATQLGTQSGQIAKELAQQNERIDRHLRVMIRLIVDFARQSGIQMRTADVLEITSLGDDYDVEASSK